MENTKEELENYIFKEKLSYEAIGRLYGITGNAVKKRALKFGIELPVKRSKNENESFGKGKSKIAKLTDAEFIDIIQSSTTYKEVLSKVGYSSRSSNNMEKIKNRCSKLGIELGKKRSNLLYKTKGEIFKDNKNWQSARSSIRRLAQNIYLDSKKPCKCAICGYDKHIEVAHIKAVADFSDGSTLAEINSINNLIALCPNHHWEYDNGYLKI